MSAAFPPLRKVRHPGPPAETRIAHAQASSARSLRLVLQPGATLQEALSRACESAGVRAGVVTLLGGPLEEVAFCLPIPGEGVVATYGEASTMSGARLVGGSATLGRAEDGALLIHCHASLADPDGRVTGGHLLPERARVGAEPIVARLTPLDGIELRLAFDEETGLNKMRPLEPASGHPEPASPPAGASGAKPGPGGALKQAPGRPKLASPPRGAGGAQPGPGGALETQTDA